MGHDGVRLFRRRQIETNAAEIDLTRQQLSGQGFALRRVLIIRRPIKTTVGGTTQTRGDRKIVIESDRLELDRRDPALRRRELYRKRSPEGRDINTSSP